MQTNSVATLDKILLELSSPSAASPRAFQLAFQLGKDPAALFSDHPEPLDFFKGTFTPDGICGVSLAPTSSSSSDSRNAHWRFYDWVLPEDEVLAVMTVITTHWSFSRTCSAVFALNQKVYTSPDGQVEAIVEHRAGENSENQILFRRGSAIATVLPKTLHWPRTLTRYVREIAGRQVEDQGYVGFHASSFSVGKHCALVIGGSGSGKSTLALAMGRFGGGRWVGNDRIMVQLKSSGSVYATPFPLPAAVNYGSLEALKISQFREWPLAWPAPDDSTDWRNFNGDFKMKLSPFELERFLGVQLGAGGEVSMVIYPRVDTKASQWSVERTDHPPALEENCLGIREHLYPDDYLSVRRSSPEQLRAYTDRVLDAVRKLPALRVITTAYADTEKVCNHLSQTSFATA
jgi:hypothetical protein